MSATGTLKVEVEDAVYRRKRASRPYRSSYPEAESVEPDIGIALEAGGRANMLALVPPGTASDNTVVWVASPKPC